WSGPSTFAAATQNISNLQPGTYKVVISESSGCSDNFSYTVKTPDVLKATADVGAISCNGGTATITVNATGGTAPYNGTGTFAVHAGSYSYTITDANGCTATVNGV